MEKMPGVRLDEVWPGMDVEARFKLSQSMVKYEAAWMSVKFEKFGSLYYAEDLDGHTQSLRYTNCSGITITDPRFAIGPSTGRGFMDDGRLTVEFDRGPCKTDLSQFARTRD